VENFWIYCFSKHGFTEADSKTLPLNARDKETWHLVDSNADLEALPNNLSGAPGRIVQASSPKISRYIQWTKQKALDAELLWLEPVTWNEVYVIAWVSIVHP
jgi:hypothetical protein